MTLLAALAVRVAIDLARITRYGRIPVMRAIHLRLGQQSLWAFLVLLPGVLVAQFSFLTNNNALTITGYSGPGGAVVIPAATNSFPVTAIRTNAFFNCTNITSLTIPGSVAIIPTNAFSQCTGVTNVTVGEGNLSIEDRAFYGCKNLLSVALPTSVTNISSRAFRYCFSLVTLTFTGDNPFYSIVDGVLFTKDMTTLVLHPAGFGTSYTIPTGVKHIAACALASCYTLTNVVIPEGVETIGNVSFDNLFRIPKIKLPDSLKSIDLYAFEYCSGMTELDLGNGVSSIGADAFNNCTQLRRVLIPASVTNMGDKVFWYCTGLTNAVVAEGVTSIGNGLFYGCQKLATAVIPATVRDMGSNTFWLCSSLTNVTLGNGITNIGPTTFYYCSQLQSLTIPASVSNVGTQAFVSCSSLTNIFFAGNAPHVGTSPFGSAPATLYYLPNTTGWFSPFAGKPAVLWNPLIQSSDPGFGVQGNQFNFKITGTANIPIVVEATSSLANPLWTPLLSARMTNGLISFADPAWANHPNRIYRIRSP